MTELVFKKEDISALAAKLAASETRLTDQERELLLAIFSAAKQHVSDQKRVSKASSDPAKFRDQLINSFVPDSGSRFLIKQRPGGHGPPPNLPSGEPSAPPPS
jgi:hypothetical protein